MRFPTIGSGWCGPNPTIPIELAPPDRDRCDTIRAGMDHYTWSQIPHEQMNDLLSRQVIHTETMTICRLRLRKGAVVPMHQHPNEQVTTMESGSLRFVVAGEEVVVRAGESLRIPPNAPHMVETLEDSVALDLFAPPRQDWISGDDAYLRK